MCAATERHTRIGLLPATRLLGFRALPGRSGALPTPIPTPPHTPRQLAPAPLLAPIQPSGPSPFARPHPTVRTQRWVPSPLPRPPRRRPRGRGRRPPGPVRRAAHLGPGSAAGHGRGERGPGEAAEGCAARPPPAPSMPTPAAPPLCGPLAPQTANIVGLRVEPPVGDGEGRGRAAGPSPPSSLSSAGRAAPMPCPSPRLLLGRDGPEGYLRLLL
jgi:hypothetical protein